MIEQKRARATAVALILMTVAASASADIYVDVTSARGTSEYGTLAENAARNYTQRLAILSQQRLNLDRFNQEFSMPVRVILTQNGQPLPTRTRSGSRGPEADITLSFETTGPRIFPSEYRTQLESTFSSAKSAINGVFGAPFAPGTVRVLNYDADIPARQAVSGGIYIPNAPGGPEIRFPVYLSATSAGINFVHTLLLAYMGDRQLPFDAYNEGFVRAATMRVSRVPGVIPNSTSEAVEQTLDSLYDNSRNYQWSNYPGLGAPQFIAPNLLTDPLPAGGSTGGIYLLRYKMAGTAWAKVLTQYPGFIRSFNQYYQLNASAYQTESALQGLGQGVLNLLAGQSGATIEGLSFAEWAQRQSILDTSIAPGLKLVPEAFPFTATPATSDFGVFGIILNAFRTSSNGNETLLNGTSYPIYWRTDFTRFFTTAQDDVIPINGGYGSVVPNFLRDEGNNTIYRAAVDLPFQGKNVRLYLPAGAYSTGTNPAPNNFYGTLVGYDQSTTGLQIRVVYSGGEAVFPVFDRAFGGTITNTAFENEQSLTIQLRNATTSAVIQTFVVNKGKGDLAVDLRSPGSFLTHTATLPARLGSFSIPIEPNRPEPAIVTGIASNQLLLGRWNSFLGRYSLYPDEGEIRQGLGYFARPSTPRNISVTGRTSETTPLAVSLQPGWNLISVPGTSSVTTANIQVTTSTQAVFTWAQAAGNTVGTVIFKFDPDPINPDLGTLTPATTLVPGQAYFIRALPDEGAVLLFNSPNRSRSISQNQTVPQGTTEQRLPFLGWGGTVFRNAWQSRLEFTSTAGHYSVVELGQRPEATFGPDRYDEPLPVSLGGFQATIFNGDNLFRDIRPIRELDHYQVRLIGLIPGRSYTIRNIALQNQISFSVTSPFFATNIMPGRTFTFIARTSELAILVRNR